MPLPPEGGHIVRLVRRKYPGPKIVHSQLPGDGGGGAETVPGEHDGVPHAQIPQSSQYILASSRSGSEMHSTAASTPSMAR